jgi:hypothetical protein
MDIQIGEIVSFRFWIYCGKSGMLFSPYSYSGWKPDEAMKMRDLSQYGSLRREIEKHAGVYGLKTREIVDKFLAQPEAVDYLRRTWWQIDETCHWAEPLGIIIGSVKMWGHVMEHSIGYRSEYACVNSIDELIEGPHLTSRLTDGKLLSEIRLRYATPCHKMA